MCNSAPTLLIEAQSISKTQIRSLQSAGLETSILRLITKTLPNPSPLVLVAALAESKFIQRSHLFGIPYLPGFSYLHSRIQPLMKERSLAYLEMRLILARMLWSFEMSLSPESKNWDDQDSWIQWDKKPLMVKLDFVK